MKKISILLVLVVLVSVGCMSKAVSPSPEQLCKQSAERVSEEALMTTEIPQTLTVVDAGTFSSFENARVVMEEYGVQGKRIEEVRKDFVGGEQPMVILKLESDFLGANWLYHYGIVCNSSGKEVMPGSVWVIYN